MFRTSGYNNFKMCGKIVTPAMVERALEDCTEGQQVQPLIDSMIASYHEQLEVCHSFLRLLIFLSIMTISMLMLLINTLLHIIITTLHRT